MDYLKIALALVMVFFLACSTSLEKTTVASSSTSGGENSTDPLFGVDTEEFEDDGQPAPVMITGASLSCVSFKNKYVCKTNIDHKIIDEYSIIDSDIEVKNLKGEILEKNVTILEDNTIIIELVDDTSQEDIDFNLTHLEGMPIDEIPEVVNNDDNTEKTEENSEELIFNQSTIEESLVEESLLEETELIISENEFYSILCKQLTDSDNWVYVPANPKYGTSDFCVMKYEAKRNGDIPSSNPLGMPWVSISQLKAIDACGALGPNFQLMSNQQWMTIASDLVLVDGNWTRKKVGKGKLRRGHSDNNPAQACPADIDDSKHYVEGSDCVGKATGDSLIQKRTSQLSTGDLIWDFTGNVQELVSDYIEDVPGPHVKGWLQFAKYLGSNSLLITDLLPNIAIDNSWSAKQGIGKFRSGTVTNGKALARGGRWFAGSTAGIFSTSLKFFPHQGNPKMGFRCTVEIP